MSIAADTSVTGRFLNDPWKPLILIMIAAMVMLVLFPVIRVTTQSFNTDGGTTAWTNYVQFFTSGYFMRCLKNTFFIGIGAILLTLVLAVPLAVLLHRYEVPGAKAFNGLLAIGMLSPPFLGSFCWILLLGNNGVVTQFFRGLGIAFPSIYGPYGIIITMSVSAFPLVYLIVSSAMKRVDPSLEEAASCLGRRPVSVFFTVTLPMLLPAVLTGAMLVFLGVISDWGTPMLIGQGERYPVLATVAYSTFLSEMGSEGGLAATTSMILLFISVGIAGGFLWVLRRLNVATDQPRQPDLKPLSRTKSVVAGIYVWIMLALNCLPVVLITLFSFLDLDGQIRDATFTLKNFRTVGGEVVDASWNSFWVSSAAFLVCVFLGTVIGYLTARRKDKATASLDALAMLPYFIPGTVLGIGFIYSFGGSPFWMTGTALILILALVIRRLPYMVRATSSIVTQIDGSLEDASRTLGFGPFQTFRRVMVPLMAPGIVAGAVLVWLEVFTELGASVVLYTADTLTLPIQTYRYALNYETGSAAAFGMVQIAVTLVVFALMRLMLGRDGLTDL